jgi:hypothetical protein
VENSAGLGSGVCGCGWGMIITPLSSFLRYMTLSGSSVSFLDFSFVVFLYLFPPLFELVCKEVLEIS